MASFCPENINDKFYDQLKNTNTKCKGEEVFSLLADIVDNSFQKYRDRALDSGAIQLGSNPSKSTDSSSEVCTCTSSSDSDTHEKSEKKGRKRRVKVKEGNVMESEDDMK